jgi:hypothetical protein
MYAGTLDEAAKIEVRIYRDDRLRVRQTCDTSAEAAAIVEQASDEDHVFLLVDDGRRDPGPGDVVTRGESPWDADDGQPIATAQLPGHGTE